MDFKTAAKLGQYISKDFARPMFELLVNYQDISASEAASRLNLHITTAQEFLEAMTELDIVTKREVTQGKRPYFRYSLKKQVVSMEIDLAQIEKKTPGGFTSRMFRERKDCGANFSTARGGSSISSVTVWTGEGRERKQRRINLTSSQGRFLYHLPFPDGKPLSIIEIMRKADVDDDNLPEILDLIELLDKHGVIETS